MNFGQTRRYHGNRAIRANRRVGQPRTEMAQNEWLQFLRQWPQRTIPIINRNWRHFTHWHYQKIKWCSPGKRNKETPRNKANITVTSWCIFWKTTMTLANTTYNAGEWTKQIPDGNSTFIPLKNTQQGEAKWRQWLNIWVQIETRRSDNWPSTCNHDKRHSEPLEGPQRLALP